MKKILVSVMAIMVAVIVLAGCSGGGTASGYVFKHGYDKDFPPYSYIDDNGETTGFDVELAKAVCEYNGWGYEGVPVNWELKENELSSGNCDCIWSGFTKSPARESKFAWSEPYSINKIKIMVPAGSSIKKLDDLKGKKVGVQTETSALEMLQTPEEEGGKKELADTFGAVQIEDTYTICVEELKAGAIDAIAIDETTGNFQMSKQEGLAYMDEDLNEEVYAIGFRTDDTKTRDKVNEALKALAENGTMEKIGKKYPDIYDSLTMI